LPSAGIFIRKIDEGPLTSAVKSTMIELARFEIHEPATKLTGGDCIDLFKRRASLQVGLEVAMAELLALRAKVAKAEREAQ
jgi:hypothetical protein